MDTFYIGMRMRRLVGLSLLMILMSFAAVRGEERSPATTQASGASAKYRESGNLSRLMVMREAVEEVDLPEETRKEGLRVMAETREQILNLVEREENSPSDPG